MRYSNIFLAFIALTTIFASCKKEEYKFPTYQKNVEETSSTIPSKLRKMDNETKAYLRGKNIVVILGYGYNDEASIEKITSSLSQNFGVETEDVPELISILVYPNDFMKGTVARVSSLVTLLEDKNLCGIISIGAPDGMHSALSKLQDKIEDGKFNFPVFSFLSQDDILGTEAVSDFVLDYAHKESGLEEETALVMPIDFDITQMLNNAVLAIIAKKGPLDQNTALAPIVQTIIGKDHPISHYVDTDTGIQSRNHFIFE